MKEPRKNSALVSVLIGLAVVLNILPLIVVLMFAFGGWAGLGTGISEIITIILGVIMVIYYGLSLMSCLSAAHERNSVIWALLPVLWGLSVIPLVIVIPYGWIATIAGTALMVIAFPIYLWTQRAVPN